MTRFSKVAKNLERLYYFFVNLMLTGINFCFGNKETNKQKEKKL